MKHIAPLILIFAPLTAHADAPRVATDILPVHALTARVMDGVGTPDLIVPANASPHGHAMRPSEAKALDEADLVIWIGESLTPWLEGPLEALGGDAQKLELLEVEGTVLHDFRETATLDAGDHDGHDHDDHGHEDHAGHDHGDHDHAKEEEHAGHDHDHDHDHDDHAHDDHAGHDHDDHDHAKEEEHAGHDHDHDHGKEEEHAGHDHGDHAGHDHHDHDHSGVDPHAWLDPANALLWTDTIAAALSEIDPDNAAAYAANAEAARAEISAAQAEVTETLSGAQNASYVVFHDAYQYFELPFGLTPLGAIRQGDAVDPSPARIAELRAEITERGVTCAMSEPQFNTRMIDTVLEGTDAKTVEIDPLGTTIEQGPDFYPNLLKAMADSLASCVD
ncbi:zinc ABC transporter substrate-binding protein [Cognatishimia sp. MH4019]|uniref:zinc ABC transporter substrate-binding protein n=1 Tax=Cognatishimia sp. MH4019 TaxID=2854030 RepID=UPI001CD4D88B|nr:zinc ABC transporter substrate-binding protein [Cognatishimia sp. MH4019]